MKKNPQTNLPVVLQKHSNEVLHCFEISLSYGKATAAETATEMKVF